MSAANTNARQLCEEKDGELRSRFLTQFGNAADANDCLLKLNSKFSNYVKYGRRESDPPLPFVLMLMAGEVSTEMMNEKRRRRENSLLNRVRGQVAQTLQGGADFGLLTLRLLVNFRGLRLRHPSPMPR